MCLLALVRIHANVPMPAYPCTREPHGTQVGHRLLQQVGQHLMISPARHPFWVALIASLVTAYDPNCYEPSNTGPGGVTTAFGELCASFRVGVFGGAQSGRVAVHHTTGSWREVGPTKRFHNKTALFAHYQRVCPSKSFVWPELNTSRCLVRGSIGGAMTHG